MIEVWSKESIDKEVYLVGNIKTNTHAFLFDALVSIKIV